MSDSQLMPINPKALALFSKEQKQVSLPTVTYGLIDSNYYSFTYEFDETIHIRMDEAEPTGTRSEFTDAEFEDVVPEECRVYYAIAAASGALTGALSFVKLSEEQLANIESWKDKDWQRIVIFAAKLIGCESDNYKKASKYLFDRAVKKIKSDETAKEYLAILSSHPTLAGLVFSLIAQFSGKQFSVSEKGDPTFKEVPKHYYIGNTNAEKILAAVFYWLFNLAANQASNHRHILNDLGIPVELLKKIKDFVEIPFLKKIPDNYEQAEKDYSAWIRNLMEQANWFADANDSEKEDHTLINRLIKMALNLSGDAFPVLINECVVRSLYILVRFCEVVKAKHVTTFEELKTIPVADILPQGGRVISKMCLIASASFVGTNFSVAALKALAEQKAGKREFAEAFYTEINIAGIGRLFFACVADSKYWGDDIKLQFQRKPRSHVPPNESHDHIEMDDAFEPLALTPDQMLLLFSMESCAVRTDIESTKDPEVASIKRKWHETWRKIVVSQFALSHELECSVFETDARTLYSKINQLIDNSESTSWFYRLTQEFVTFEHYSDLGSDLDAEFRKLKMEYDYLDKQFILLQNTVSSKEVYQIIEIFGKYKTYVSGKIERRIKTLAVGAVTTVATGGLAFAYAPSIAVLIAGKAVLGLHGAALTSASLALVGGGSLAAGGLGMAGGTVIITSGGALLGLASSGSVSAATAVLSASSEDWIRDCAKMLTYCKCTLHDILGDKTALLALSEQINLAAERIDEELSVLKKEKNALDKDYIKNLDIISGYLDKVRKELKKIMS